MKFNRYGCLNACTSTSWLAEAVNWKMGIPMYNLLLTSRPAGWPAALSATSVDSRSIRRAKDWIKWTRPSRKHELKHEYIKWKLPFHFVYCTSYFFFFLVLIRQGRTMVRLAVCLCKGITNYMLVWMTWLHDIFLKCTTFFHFFLLFCTLCNLVLGMQYNWTSYAHILWFG